MKRKQVWRYYCEFCKKSNCSAGSIKHHENGCTANPNRVCSMHKHCDNPQIPLGELMAPLFANAKDKNWKNGLDQLRTLASNCPACILSAIRQSNLQKLDIDEETGENLAADFEFDFKKEVAEFWSVVNDAAYQSEENYS